MSQLNMTRDVVTGWQAIRPSIDLSPLGVVQRLLWCGRLTESLLEKAAQAAGLRHRGDYEVLAIIRRSEPKLLAPVDVAEALLSSPSGMTGKLDRLETQGLLTRTRDESDRRVIRILLTQEGRRVADNSFDLGLELYARMLGDLSTEDREILDELLSVVLHKLDSLYRVRRPWEGGIVTRTANSQDDR